MPKFSTSEKEIIRRKLIEKGESLFANVGLRKVTIDNLSEAVGISHSAFYSFFPSKEELFMEINLEKQNSIFTQLEKSIEQNRKLGPQDLTRKTFQFLANAFFSDLFLCQIDSSVWEQLLRKLPKELLEKNNQIDLFAVNQLITAGVKFRYAPEIVTNTAQAAFIGISNTAPERREIVRDILMNALIAEMVL